MRRELLCLGGDASERCKKRGKSPFRKKTLFPGGKETGHAKMDYYLAGLGGGVLSGLRFPEIGGEGEGRHWLGN